jgi:hypothetical protein
MLAETSVRPMGIGHLDSERAEFAGVLLRLRLDERLLLREVISRAQIYQRFPIPVSRRLQPGARLCAPECGPTLPP